MAKDLYEVLGVTKNASADEIKKAYRSLAIKLHPDRFANASEKEKKDAETNFKEINHAYEVLSDETKKSNYDQYGDENGPQGFGGFGGGDGQSAGGFGGGFDDILNTFFGGSFGGKSRNPNAPMQGDDIQVRIDVTFEEAYNGVTKTVRLNRDEACPDCNGTGAKNGTSVKTCPYCNGSGYIRRTQNTLFGQQTVQSVCSHCGGKGKIVEEKCKTCRGTGFVRKEATVKVPIPAGADTGVRMTIRNEGNCGANGGGKGNLVVVIYVAESDTFRRVGADLYMDLPIGYYEAACGCDISIDTMKGQTTVKVPESTQPGTKIRIKGYGMKVLQKEVYGDLYITIKVETPRGLSSKQLKLLREFEESLSETQYPQKRRFGKK